MSGRYVEDPRPTRRYAPEREETLAEWLSRQHHPEHGDIASPELARKVERHNKRSTTTALEAALMAAFKKNAPGVAAPRAGDSQRREPE